MLISQSRQSKAADLVEYNPDNMQYSMPYKRISP